MFWRYILLYIFLFFVYTMVEEIYPAEQLLYGMHIIL